MQALTVEPTARSASSPRCVSGFLNLTKPRLALVLVAFIGSQHGIALAQAVGASALSASSATGSAVVAGTNALQTSATSVVAGSSAKRAPTTSVNSLTQPEWGALTDAQRAAVRPLYADWAYMPANQKRKWIELTVGFAAMPVSEQAKVHARMSSWSALSPQQRTQARINFAEATSSLNAKERREKWQAYQQLSAEEKQRLRLVGKGEQPKGAAIVPRTASSDRLAAVPKSAASSPKGVDTARSKQTPKIAVVSATPSQAAASRSQ